MFSFYKVTKILLLKGKERPRKPISAAEGFLEKGGFVLSEHRNRRFPGVGSLDKIDS